ncbi:MAG TPA: hypothetical protein VGM78_14455 [Ilumatobacteraceae bacterium]
MFATVGAACGSSTKGPAPISTISPGTNANLPGNTVPASPNSNPSQGGSGDVNSTPAPGIGDVTPPASGG